MTPGLVIIGAFVAAILVGASVVWGAPVFAIPVLLLFVVFLGGYSFIARARTGTSRLTEAKKELDLDSGSPVPKR